ncbi:MAG: hypothetical protein CMB99_09640 [Flavobacteriaceae bacterium]|nr:hypothetical protein [Flavobacteriaceae bacterium]|tara:strand:+ start:405337 stop:405807 length:471 start_codon:yes stop_codon:yes gene_type:complete
MQMHAIGFDEFDEDDFFLIGIHTTLEDYRLAYLLNVTLKTNLKKANNYLMLNTRKKKASFSIFTYENPKYEDQWDLISNSSKTEITDEDNPLLVNTEIKTFLIPEQKKIDYFIKITGNVTLDYVKRTAKKIQSIEQIITSYFIDNKTLKSKEYLIF